MKCLIRAWLRHECELRGWLISRLGNRADAEDLLQDLFEKGMLQGERFCLIDNPRAWLFRVARNRLTDHYRLSRDQVELPEDMPAYEQESDAVDNLSECLPRVLLELSADDREVITLCDLDGMSQQHFANLKDISLPAVKSRIQRARRRLRRTLETNCKVLLNDNGNVCCFVPRPPLQ
ncbi:MAG: RNA polymerase subunit sigma-70 [Zetaproteobacteria bacterium CG12_big_fil_rev_8_21_14_0_65_54_13]|nr:MAG: RNA polymerase subunit sigma-70 [Zetaproteobacteria bacterium CG12_big_fil_rev_8_21_14_0_65_54_13]PIX53722.1 MAG: RNA polymerase subunit sigma-70 [Zetaproteobacteria bacterium CG_4_10_14_3_um_filter_54_28]PJA31183.1 MAG: RNA polymerase subunit sigma-70 [Zetaproteobacteria bacterium CG_4_9_14_3_um_filter_54_145]